VEENGKAAGERVCQAADLSRPPPQVQADESEAVVSNLAA